MSSTPWTLNWISENRLLEICNQLIDEASPKNKDLDYENIVDPFSALFDMAVNEMTYDIWKMAEIRRQQQKTLQNAIGKFHQMVLGSIDGWRDLAVGDVVDLQNDERKIFAEIKNKFNTVKGSDKKVIYDAMTGYRFGRSLRDYTGYYVQILTKKSFNKVFTPSDNTKGGIKCGADPHIREIDGRSFYALATGSSTALDDLYNVLPDILEKATRGEFSAKEVTAHPMFEDLLARTRPKNK